MRLALFGSGSPLSRSILDALAARHQVVGVVLAERLRLRRPIDLLRGRARERALEPLARRAKESGIPVVRYGPRSRDASDRALRGLWPEALVVASFPYLLGPETLDLAPCGGLNVHSSLLPRHRGPDPLFWTYFEDDRETGMTVHRITTEPDAGEVVAQKGIPLDRGSAVTETYLRLCDLGRDLTVEALERLAKDPRAGTPQPRPAHPSEPKPRPGRPVLDPARWPSERAWHVLAGLGHLYPWLLQDSRGRIRPHGRALGWEGVSGDGQAGKVQRTAGGWIVHCADGIVRVAAAPLPVRMRVRLAVWGSRRRGSGDARVGRND